jgi:hypothetical protein
MNTLVRSTRVGATVLLELGVLVALLRLGRRRAMAVPVHHLGAWLRDGDPATVVVALVRWIALAVVVWLLASTLLYLALTLARLPGAVRAVRWSTLPAVRRAVDAACAVSAISTMAVSVVLAPAVAGATGPTDPPSVSLVRDGHGGGALGGLPADPTTSTSTTTSTPIARATTLPPAVVPTSPAPATPPGPHGVAATQEVVVVEGDNLWVLAARRVASSRGVAPADVPDGDVAPYWTRVCQANASRLASGDPDLVYPGERVLLPPV